MESKADDAADCDDMATMSQGGRWVINCELSCDLRFQPLQFLSEARGTYTIQFLALARMARSYLE